MSDLDPSPTSVHPELVDPDVTRLLHRDLSGPSTRLIERLGPVATSMSFISSSERATGLCDRLAAWRPQGVRFEVVVTADRDGARLSPPRSAEEGQIAWHSLVSPLGGRAVVLSAAVEAAEHEFVVVGDCQRPPVAMLEAALGHMWADGCDAALIDPALPELLSTSSAEADPAGELASWLASAQVADRMVVLRRWVARWLFNEVTRAIDPWSEVADRARLLGFGIVTFSAAAVPEPPRTVGH
jgi:hypothetical protein